MEIINKIIKRNREFIIITIVFIMLYISTLFLYFPVSIMYRGYIKPLETKRDSCYNLEGCEIYNCLQDLKIFPAETIYEMRLGDGICLERELVKEKWFQIINFNGYLLKYMQKDKEVEGGYIKLFNRRGFD